VQKEIEDEESVRYYPNSILLLEQVDYLNDLFTSIIDSGFDRLAKVMDQQ
jgi:hypothetical protein